MGPNQAAVIGAVGNDELGSEHVRIFNGEGVVVTGLKFCDDAESGQAFTIVDKKGDNMIYSYRGANENLSPEDLDDPSRRQLIEDAAIVTIMNPPYDTALKLAKEAKRLQKTVAWDPGVKSELGVTKIKELLENVNYLVANVFEIENLTGIRNSDRAAGKLIGINRELNVVEKMGPKGCMLYHGKERFASNALDLKSRRLRVVNTVGCGDRFLEPS